MAKDLAYEKNLRDDPKKSIRSGFFWIGLASIISQGLGAITMIIAMLFMDADEMGTATIALSFAVIFEAFNALGTNQALLQDNKLTPDETHSVFWFASGFGILTFLVAAPLAWPVARFYGLEELVPLFIVSMFKLPLVSIAAIPFQLVNRRLEYHKISAINAFTTIACSILKIVLAICGFGAWAIVIGDTTFGLGTLIGAFVCAKYVPKFHFKGHECKRFIKYGIKFCLSNGLDQLNKNLHYLIIGKFLGEAPLGIYRIAYELAMTPALALFNVVGKSSFPVFARIRDKRDELSELFLWNQRNIAIFAAVPSVFIFFSAEDIFSIMNKPAWMDCVPVIPFVLGLSFFRAILQAYPDLYRACGRPDIPILTGIIEMGLFSCLASGVLCMFPEFGTQGMLVIWIAILFAFFGIHSHFAKRFIDISIKKILSSIRHGLGFILLSFALSIPLWFLRDGLPWKSWTHITIEVLIIAISLFIYTKYVLKVSLKDFFKRKKKA